MKFIALLIASSMFVLSACAPINTQFSCNETAGDRCLSIEEVHAMTEKVDKDVAFSKECTTCNHKQTIWFAPWKDQYGHIHSSQMSFAH